MKLFNHSTELIVSLQDFILLVRKSVELILLSLYYQTNKVLKWQHYKDDIIWQSPLKQSSNMTQLGLDNWPLGEDLS